MENLPLLLIRPHECLGRICEVEPRLYATGIKAFFTKHNYNQYGRSLSMEMAELQNISDNIQADTFDVPILKQAAFQYIDALRASTAKLQALNSALQAKAEGHSYDMGEYLSDYREFKQYQSEYSELGEHLKQIYLKCLTP